MRDMGACEGRIIDRIEYYTSGAENLTAKDHQQFCGVEARKSDGITCLSVRFPGKTRRHNIEVARVFALTIDGHRCVIETPENRWHQRITEIFDLVATNEWPDDFKSAGKPATEISLQISDPMASRAEIKYPDILGNGLNRIVQPTDVSGYWSVRRGKFIPLAIKAFCEMRQQSRSFLIDKIESVRLPETSEKITAMHWVDQFSVSEDSLARLNDIAGDELFEAGWVEHKKSTPVHKILGWVILALPVLIIITWIANH